MKQDRIAELVAQVPPLDKDGKFTGPSWSEAIPTLEGLLEAGKDGVAALVGMLKEVDDGQDHKPRYLIHVLAVYVGRPELAAKRMAFAQALAEQLATDRPKPVLAYLARQLQVCGSADQAPALGKLLLDEQTSESAAQALLAIGRPDEFRKALPAAQGRPRLTILQALATLRDAESIPALRQAVADPVTRSAAAWGLARLPDPDSIDLVLKAADVEPGPERFKNTHSCLLLAENLLAAGRKDLATRIYTHLRDSRTEASEAYVKEIATKALAP